MRVIPERDILLAQELGHRPVLIWALTPSAILVLIRPAKPCFEIYMQEQCDTFGVRDIDTTVDVDGLSCRSTGEASCLVLPGIHDHAPDLLAVRPDAQRPAADLRVASGELSPFHVSSDVGGATAPLVSLKLSGMLLLSWVLTHLISGPPMERRTGPFRSTGYAPKEISV
jgi:hypothetical protein